MTRKLTAIIEREGDGYVASARKWMSSATEIPSPRRGTTWEEALALFFETASAEEIEGRLRDEVYVTQVQVAYQPGVYVAAVAASPRAG